MLREDFLPDYGLTVASVAEALGVSRHSINELLRERRSVSPEMALQLSRLFSNSPEFWLNLQSLYELRTARTGKGREIHRRSSQAAATRCHSGVDQGTQ